MKSKTAYAIFLTFLLTSTSMLALSVLQGKSSSPPNVEWSQTFGGARTDYGFSILETSEGEYTVCGSVNQTETAFLAKYDSAGNQLWNKTYGGNGWEETYSHIATPDGGFALSGMTNSFGAGDFDLWLVKTDENGNMMWNKTYGGNGSELVESSNCVTLAQDGGYALAGGTDSFGAGGKDYYLVKTDANGNILWNRTFGGTYDEWARSVTQTSDGGYAVGGFMFSPDTYTYDAWLVKTDSTGNMEWNRKYKGGSAFNSGPWGIGVWYTLETSDGGYLIAGGKNVPSPGIDSAIDFWLIRTDSAGNPLWNKTYGGIRHETCLDATPTTDGGLALVGYTDTATPSYGDYWLVRVDSSGAMLWNQTFGGSGFDEAWSVIATHDGGYALAGYTGSLGAGSYDAWIVKLEGTPNITATVNVDPNSLNLRSEGQWITAYIELPEEHDVNNIQVSSIRLNETYPVDPTAPTQVGDYDSDGVSDLMVKFNRTELISYIYNVLGIRIGNVTLIVSGQLIDGSFFNGVDNIRVIFAGDANNDSKVDTFDLHAVGKCYAATLGEPAYRPEADLNADGVIDDSDLLIMNTNYGGAIP